MSSNRERELLEKFREVKKLKESAEAILEQTSKEFEKAKTELIEYMETAEVEATSRYEGLGYASIGKPTLYASYDVADESKVFEFLIANDYDHVIKETVHKGTLSSVVKELMEAGKTLPPFVKFFLKPNVKFYGTK